MKHIQNVKHLFPTKLGNAIPIFSCDIKEIRYMSTVTVWMHGSFLNGNSFHVLNINHMLVLTGKVYHFLLIYSNGFEYLQSEMCRVRALWNGYSTITHIIIASLQRLRCYLLCSNCLSSTFLTINVHNFCMNSKVLMHASYAWYFMDLCMF